MNARPVLSTPQIDLHALEQLVMAQVVQLNTLTDFVTTLSAEVRALKQEVRELKAAKETKESAAATVTGFFK